MTEVSPRQEKRLGFMLDGRLRRAQRLHGVQTDIYVCGLLREEWTRLRAMGAAG
jgi:RimJ/RimL family protein N-acetyltransferase